MRGVLVGQIFGLKVQVFMGEDLLRTEAEPAMLDWEAFGARRVASLSEEECNSGHAILEQDSTRAEALGIAMRSGRSGGDARRDEDLLGSVVNHVLMDQSVIGEETEAGARAADYPDVVIGWTGRGPNFSGTLFWVHRPGRRATGRSCA